MGFVDCTEQAGLLGQTVPGLTRTREDSSGGSLEAILLFLLFFLHFEGWRHSPL